MEWSPETIDRCHWYSGDLHRILHPDMQTRVYFKTKAWRAAHPNSAKPFVWNLHRAAGKTFMLVLLCFERAIKRPGQEIRFAAATTDQCVKIVQPNVEKLIELCPEDLRPEVREGGELLVFRHPARPGAPPSRLHFIGCRERARLHRGKRSNMIAIDECREFDDFDYVAKTIFGPHFAKMEDPDYILSSTPPESMDHPFISVYCENASRDGRYFEGPVSEDLDWTPADDERMLEQFHSKESSEWLREMECQRISDPTRLIVREFDERRHVVESWDRPKEFIPLVSADGGFVDFFGCVFGYVDFERQKYVVEDSFAVPGKNTEEIAGMIREKEESLWGEEAVGEDGPKVTFKVRPRRNADLTPRELADLDQIYKMPFWPADRTNAMNYSDPDSQIAHLRTNFARDKIVILGGGRNVELIRQLKNGVRDKAGKIKRSDVLGHCDALMALVYGNKVAPWGTMPPHEPELVDPHAQHVPRRHLEPEYSGPTRGSLWRFQRRRFA